MSKEAMKLALEKIANVNAMDYEYQAWAREALAEPDFWEGYVPEPTMYLESGGLGYGPAPERKLIIGYVNKSEQPVKPATEQSSAVQPAQQDSTCSNALRAQGKAYPRTCKKCGLGPCIELAQQALDKKAENARELGLDYEPAQQEPVAWKWQQAPIRTAWGDEMVVASIAIDKDHTLSLYCERDQSPKVEAMFAQRTWVGLTDQEIEQGCKESWVTEQAWQSAVWWAEAKLKEKNT